jgi:hypothetical protein
MSSLQKIDELFKQAQEAIINGDPEQARTVLWPEIKFECQLVGHIYPGLYPDMAVPCHA